MDEQTKPDHESSDTGPAFVIPGTSEVARGDEADLRHCAHCGATLSSGSEFCQVCAVSVSGGERPEAAE